MAKKSKKNEITELEASYGALAGTIEKKNVSKGRLAVIISCSVVLAFILAAAAVMYFFPEIWQPKRVEANITVGGIQITGMTREETLEALKPVADSYLQNTLTVTAGEHTAELTPALTQASLNIESVADAALALPADAETMDILPHLHLDEQTIRSLLDDIRKSNESPVVHGSWEVTGATDTAAGITDMKLIVTMGKQGLNLDVDMLYEAVCTAYNQFEFTVDYPLEQIEPNAPDLDAAHHEHSIAPVDAVMDMETFKVSEHSYGYTFDLEAAKAAIQNAQYEQVVEIDFTVVEPGVYADSLRAMLYRDVLGTYTAYSSSKPGGRDVNLQISCEKIDGTILFPGEVFDYNKALGQRTEEGGWKKADGYSYGDTVSVYGGGICQASSALYYCTLLADVEIVTRINHSYVSSYMPLGMDATVSWGGPDFRFKNTTEYPIRIEAKANKGTVTVNLIGTDTKDYYIKMEYEVLEKEAFKTVYKELTPDEAEGYKDGQQMVSGYVGHKVVTYKCKYNKETDQLISREKEATSTYKRRDRVICKIVEPETPPTEPVPTEAPPVDAVPPSESIPVLDGTVTEDT